MERNNKLAIIAVVLTVAVVAFGLYTARKLLTKPAQQAGKKTAPVAKALTQARTAYQQGRFDVALKAARRAANAADAETRRAARIIEAAAQTSLADPKAPEAWAAIMNDPSSSAQHRARAAVQFGRLRMTAQPPDLPGAVAAFQQALESAVGTGWGDEAAISLADAHLSDKRLDLAEAVLGAYLVKAKDPVLIQAKICEVNMAILFSPLITDMPKSVKYTVQRGDSLARIAKKFKTTVDLLSESNNIHDPHLLQVGDRLKVVTDPFRIVVDKSENTLSLFCHDTLMKKYRVGTGEYDKTPIGEFKIVSKDVDPPWKGIPFGDPRNVLGTRWMKITDENKTLSGYGIHGTWQPETIGTYKSQGCVRMLNAEVEQLFKIVTFGTPVSIVE